MKEKRRHPRYNCQIKTKFKYFTGDPDNTETALKPEKGKGYILDISQGGVFIATNNKVQPGMPITITFKTKKKKETKTGKILRTGLLANNPSEVAQRFKDFSRKSEAYIAVEFEEIIPSLDEKDVCK